MTMTIDTAKVFAQDIAPLVRQYLVVRAAAEVISKHMHDLDVRILNAANYAYDVETFGNEYGEFCKDPKHAYLMTEQASEAYNAVRREAVAASEWFVSDPDFCPALVAENDATKLETLIIRKGAKAFECPQFEHIYGEKRRELVKHLIGLAVSFDGFQKPTQKDIETELRNRRK